MKVIIDAYDLWKLELPAGRVIGDCTCHYHSFDVWVVCLKTNQGHSGWGFGETISKGIFTKPAPWITPMPTLADIRQRFERNAWPVIHGNHPFQLKMHLPRLFSDPSYFDTAIRIALWDLMAKLVELPLYQLLGASEDQNKVRAYASGLDFPLSQGEALALFKNFVDRGFQAVKVKVGHPDVRRDLQRLQAVRQTVGDQVDLAIDANEAWSCEQAIERLQLFQREGIPALMSSMSQTAPAPGAEKKYSKNVGSTRSLLTISNNSLNCEQSILLASSDNALVRKCSSEKSTCFTGVPVRSSTSLKNSVALIAPRQLLKESSEAKPL